MSIASPRSPEVRFVLVEDHPDRVHRAGKTYYQTVGNCSTGGFGSVFLASRDGGGKRRGVHGAQGVWLRHQT